MDSLSTTDKKNALLLTGKLAYDSQIKLFNDYLQGREANLDTVAEYLETLKNSKSPATFELAKSALKKAILKTYRQESLNIMFLTALDAAFKEIKAHKTDKKIYKKDILSPENINTLIEKSPKKTGLFIKIMAKSGLRVSEMLNIKFSDCSIINAIVHIKILGKGRKARTVQIPKNYYDDLAEHFQGRKYLFENKKEKPYTRIRVYQLIKEAGLAILARTDLHPHHLRHFFASHHIKTKKHTVKAVSNYLGHSTTAITNDMYVHDELSAEHLFDEEELF